MSKEAITEVINMPEEGSAPRIVDSFPEWVKSGRSGYMNALREQMRRKEPVPAS